MRRRMGAAIRSRTVLVLLHGKTIETFEYLINDFKDMDICYAGINQFTLTENNILAKIGKRFDIVQDCSEVAFPDEYEPKLRVPRISQFVQRPDQNCVLTTEKVYGIWCKRGLGWTKDDERYVNKFVLVEPYVLRSVPNSLALYLLYLARFGAKKIILLGCDGYVGKPNEDLLTYYRHEEVAEEREIGFHDKNASGLHSDSSNFEIQFTELYTWYKAMHGIPDIEIVNCSPHSTFNLFRKINYDTLKAEII